MATKHYLIQKIRHQAIQLFLRIHSLWNALLKLMKSKDIYYAEYFTDRDIRKLFFPNFDYKGIFVEVGCATPELISMSQHFRVNGWRCIGIEPNPKFVELHRKAGNEVYEYAAADFESDAHDFTVVESSCDYSDNSISAHSYSALSIKPDYALYNGGIVAGLKKETIPVKVRRLDTILEQHCPEITHIDILSVDVEGYELEVMRGLSIEKFKPKVVVLENLLHLDAYSEYMQSRGYRLHHKVKYNYIYVPH